MHKNQSDDELHNIPGSLLDAQKPTSYFDGNVYKGMFFKTTAGSRVASGNVTRGSLSSVRERFGLISK